MNDNTFEKCYQSNKYDCAGCVDGKCHYLSETWFGGKPCPFFKTRKQVIVEKAQVIKKLSKEGRIDFTHLSEAEKKFYVLTAEEEKFLERHGYEYLLR